MLRMQDFFVFVFDGWAEMGRYVTDVYIFVKEKEQKIQKEISWLLRKFSM